MAISTHEPPSTTPMANPTNGLKPDCWPVRGAFVAGAAAGSLPGGRALGSGVSGFGAKSSD